MNISQIINSSIISKNNFSPNGKYLLVPKGKNLILYSLNPDIKKLDKMLFNSTINYIEFSPSSTYFLILLLKLQECFNENKRANISYKFSIMVIK